MNLSLSLAILSILPGLLQGKLIETANIEEILWQANELSPEKVLVVCDIDNTLLQGSQFLGSVAWGDYVIAQLESKGIPRKEALKVENILWRAVQPRIKVKCVDGKTPEVIREIQKRNISIIALTAREPVESPYTFQQLRSLGISFTMPTVFSPQQFDIEEESALYEDGILFATPYMMKSKVLFAFLEREGIAPEHIIFVDDKMSHVEDVGKACRRRGISYTGIRFAGADLSVKNFDPKVAAIQWEAFPNLVSDAEAKTAFATRSALQY